MRVSRERVELIAGDIVDRLLTEAAVAVAGDTAVLKTHVASIIAQELSAEDRLNQEVRTLLKQYQRQIDSGEVDYQKMFSMVKRQLAKERGVIL